MATSNEFLPLLDSVRQLLDHYAIQTAMTSIRVINESDQRQHVEVRLEPGNLRTVSAGLVEWHQTLAAGHCVASRSTDGVIVHLTVRGHIDEDGTDVEVWGSTPHDERHIGSDLLPGERAAVPFEVLAVWAIGLGG